jgi:hypothetical protein
MNHSHKATGIWHVMANPWTGNPTGSAIECAKDNRYVDSVKAICDGCAGATFRTLMGNASTRSTDANPTHDANEV